MRPVRSWCSLVWRVAASGESTPALARYEAGVNSSGWVELADDFDEADDVVVQCFEIFCRDPPFGVVGSAYALHWVFAHEGRADLEAGDGAVAAVAYVPRAGDFGGVLFVGDRVEDG